MDRLKECSRDGRVSLKAVGLLTLLVLNPELLEGSAQDLIPFSSDGRDGIYSAVAELKRYGYLEQTYLRDRGRVVGSRFSIPQVTQGSLIQSG